VKQEAKDMGIAKRISSKSFIAGTAIVLSLLVVLGGFRFYSFRLEYLLSEINRGIESYSTEEIELWQTFSGLTSPIKVYSYCKDKLGMNNPKNVEVVHVRGPRVAAAPSPENPKGWRSGVLSLLGFSMN
jgi:cell division protein FtsL